MNRSIILSSLMLLSVAAGSVSAKPSDMRNAYEDGWKWYVYRKSQGADSGELLDILRTLKEKYGFTYFNLTRVDRALEELNGSEVSADYDMPLPETREAPRAQESAQLQPEPFLATYASPEVVTRAAPAVVAKAAPVVAQAAPVEPKPAPIVAPAAPAEKQDPFERYLASQQAQVKSQGQLPPAVVPAPKIAPQASVSVPAAAPKVPPVSSAAVPVPAVALQNPQAQAKIDELSSSDDMVKVKAAQALGDMREPGAIGPLIALLGGSSTFASMSASAALAKIGTPAVKPVINALQDPNPSVRIGACVALGDMHDPAIAPALQKAALDGDSRVRRAASTALSKIKPAK